MFKIKSDNANIETSIKLETIEDTASAVMSMTLNWSNSKLDLLYVSAFSTKVEKFVALSAMI